MTEFCLRLPGKQGEEVENMLEAIMNPAALLKGSYTLGETMQSAAQSLGLSKIYKMNSNENPYGVSPLASQAMAEAAYRTNLYPDPTGRELREKLAAYLGEGLKADNIVLTEGASVAISLLADMVLNPGDEVIEHWPTYSGYQRRMMDTRQAVAVKVAEGADRCPDFDAMYEAISDKTRLIVICNPNNPTGVLADAKKLYPFIRKIPPHIIVMVDEAYIDFVDDEKYPSALGLVHEIPNLVVLRTFSKISGLAGARIGYAVACPEMIFYYNNLVNFFCASTAALAGASAALEDTAFREMTREKNRKGREYLLGELGALGLDPYPSQANFVACDIKGLDSNEVAELLRKKGILIRGNLGIPRITVGDEEANQACIKAIREIMEERGLL